MSNVNPFTQLEAKPISTEEKFMFTAQTLAQRGVDEILSTLFWDEQYNGLVDLWLEVAHSAPQKKNKKATEAELVVRYKKVGSPFQKLSQETAVRYELKQGRGVRLLTKKQDPPNTGVNNPP